MEAPAWILVIFLSVALFVFLMLGIILLIKLISLTKEAKKIVRQGQNIAETAGDIADNVRDFTSIGGLVRYFSDSVIERAENRKKNKRSKNGNKKEK